ncbi:MAG: restriction endonuclease subunit S [Verrucomicrobiota bacterium]
MPASKTAKAPKGRTIPSRGIALGNPPRMDVSPEPERSGDRPPTGGLTGVTEGNQRAAHLPSGWRWVTLREIAEISGGVTKGQKRKPHDVVRSVPYLRVANVQRGYIDLTEVKEIEVTEREIQAHTLLPGDILFNEGGDRDKLGRGWVWNGEIKECIHQNHVFRARLRNSDDSPKFVSYYGNSGGKQYFFDQGKHTTNLASINLTKLGGLPIPFPPPEVQHRIVAEIEKHFTRLDAGVAALRRAQANLKRYRAAVLKAACEGRLVPTEAELHKSRSCVLPLSSNKRRQDADSTFETGHQLLLRILTERRQNWQGRGKYKVPDEPDTSILNALPEGWTWATVEQLSSRVQYGSSAKTKEDPNGVPVLRMGNIKDGKFDFEKLKYLPREHNEFPELLLTKGDLLFNRTNSADLVGKTAVYNEALTRCSFASYLIRVQIIGGCAPDFVSFFINSVFGRAWINQVVSQQVGQANVNGTKLQALAVPLPPLAEQSRIVAEVERRFSIVDEMEFLVSANLQRATSLRRAICNSAFNKSKL